VECKDRLELTIHEKLTLASRLVKDFLQTLSETYKENSPNPVDLLEASAKEIGRLPITNQQNDTMMHQGLQSRTVPAVKLDVEEFHCYE
jgi:hypothetical protein